MTQNAGHNAIATRQHTFNILHNIAKSIKKGISVAPEVYNAIEKHSIDCKSWYTFCHTSYEDGHYDLWDNLLTFVTRNTKMMMSYIMGRTAISTDITNIYITVENSKTTNPSIELCNDARLYNKLYNILLDKFNASGLLQVMHTAVVYKLSDIAYKQAAALSNYFLDNKDRNDVKELLKTSELMIGYFRIWVNFYNHQPYEQCIVLKELHKITNIQRVISKELKDKFYSWCKCHKDDDSCDNAMIVREYKECLPLIDEALCNIQQEYLFLF